MKANTNFFTLRYKFIEYMKKHIIFIVLLFYFRIMKILIEKKIKNVIIVSCD